MNSLRRGAGLGLVMLMLIASQPRFTPTPADPAAGPGDSPALVEGRGWLSALACAGCAAGAIAIASGGWGAVLVAAAAEGSTLIVAGCIGACIDAFN